MFNHNIHYYCTIDCISKINKTLSDNVAHLQKINLKLVLCPGDFPGSEKEDKKNIRFYYSVFFRVFFSCVYFFLEIYSSEYSPKAKIFFTQASHHDFVWSSFDPMFNKRRGKIKGKSKACSLKGQRTQWRGLELTWVTTYEVCLCQSPNHEEEPQTCAPAHPVPAGSQLG